MSYLGPALDYDIAATEAKSRHPNLETRVAAEEDMLTPSGSLRRYFDVGECALECIKEGMRVAGTSAPARILDLPCGYGRVLRWLRAAWPDADITAMDIVPAAVDFCAATFGARPVRSRQPLWLVQDAGDRYDLLWSGSLLTHFDSPDWGPILTYFRDRLEPGGLLVFTTHGDLSIGSLAGDPSAVARTSRWIPPDYGMGVEALGMAETARATGFAFRPYANNPGPYGLSVCRSEWVRKMSAEVGGLEFVLHEPAGWFDHQDVWTFRRI